jgi:hypothetical protein
LRHALHTLIFERAPQIRADFFRKRRVLADEHRLCLILQDGLHHTRAAFNHSEVAVSPARNTCIGEHAKDDAAFRRTEVVNSITGEFGRRQAQ